MCHGADGLFDFADEIFLIGPGDCLYEVNAFITHRCRMLNGSALWEYTMLWNEIEGT